MTDAPPQKRPNALLSLIVWLLPPSRFKIWALRRLGNTIGERVTLGPTLVLNCGPFEIGDDAVFYLFNTFRNLARVRLGRHAIIGSFNQLTAAPDYQRFSPWVGWLILEEHAALTNRHYVDCSGQVILHPYATIGGIKSIVQSHEIDLVDNKTTLGRVVLGAYAMSGTAVILLKDAYLPERSVLAAGSVVLKRREGAELPTSTLYGGVPAKPLRPVPDDFAWYHRENHVTPATAFDDTQFRLT
ncbi:hypothetical protein LV457_04960 [Mycobacterium sp. MYCO198283]|uniref:acyltransferase n=1 Tax=Mycobacterium sp. MYCO198283 TaxID=2883505 RepID=UPI001E628686|nr:hypothetical protein [Mycobacterium sp. MYCO198283]MCG5431641.1 hypothetical protein [Mycobacterium sp. MYCO198283]